MGDASFIIAITISLLLLVIVGVVGLKRTLNRDDRTLPRYQFICPNKECGFNFTTTDSLSIEPLVSLHLKTHEK